MWRPSKVEKTLCSEVISEKIFFGDANNDDEIVYIARKPIVRNLASRLIAPGRASTTAFR
ncbi:c6 zinc finger domain protein [Moniliophthora roreri]|nr:c6 zinc finger domain protein [Moniliophthora roreri]